MLTDYILKYIDAQDYGDTKMMNKIVKDMEKLGMDKMTLDILAKEIRSEQGNGDKNV